MSPNKRYGPKTSGVSSRKLRVSAGLAFLAAGFSLAAAGCGTSTNMAQHNSANWASTLESACSAKSSTSPSISIEETQLIKGADLKLSGDCLVEIDNGSLTLDDSRVTIGTLGIVLSPTAKLIIENSTVKGSSPRSTMSVSSSGGSQTIKFHGDTIDVARGMIVEVGLGSPATNGVASLEVSNTSITETDPNGLGIEFISKGPASFTTDHLRTAANGGRVVINTSTMSACKVFHVTGYQGTSCQMMPASAPASPRSGG